MDDEYDEHDEELGPATCAMCDGTGKIIICPDDLCRSAGECMHRDGERVCPKCNGDGLA